MASSKQAFIDSAVFRNASAYVLLRDGEAVGRMLVKHSKRSVEVGIQVFADCGPLSECRFSQSYRCGINTVPNALVGAISGCLEQQGHAVPSQISNPQAIFEHFGYTLFKVF